MIPCSVLNISVFVINISATSVEISLPQQELQSCSVSWFSSCWRPYGYFFTLLTFPQTGGGIVILPQAAKAWGKGQKKEFPSWDSSEVLMSAESWSPASSSLVGRCLLVDALHLNLLVWVNSFLLSALDLNLALGSIFYSFLYHLGPWVSRHSTFLGHTAVQFLFGLETYFGKGRHHRLIKKVKHACCSWQTPKCTSDISQGV